MSDGQILVAGIGNIFLGDDAFGCEAVQRLAQQPTPDCVRVVDYGIRGFDLAFALLDPYDAFILVDALPRGGQPGTLYTLEIDSSDLEEANAGLEPHAMNPVTVLSMVQAMGGNPQNVYVVGCEPSLIDEERMGLSEPVQAAVDEAVVMIQSLLQKLISKKGASNEESCDSDSSRSSGRVSGQLVA
jgi:hydrogenase maturation protease